jgi:hypothetical protein
VATNPPFLVLPSRERLLQLVDYAVQGAWPPDDCRACPDPAAGQRCEEHQQLEEDAAILGRILLGVQLVATDAEAQEAVLAGLTELAGRGNQ